MNWPASSAAWLLWAHLLVWWFAIRHVRFDRDTEVGPADGRPRNRLWATNLALCAAWMTACCVAARPFASVMLFALGAAALAMLVRAGDAGRSSTTRSTHLVEVAIVAIVPVVLALAVGMLGLQQRVVLVRWPTTDATVTRVLVLSSALLVVTRSGTCVVRGLLHRLRIEPGVRAGFSEGVSESAFPSPRTGRVIGELERGLLLVFALAGSYEAVGFLVAAKSFVRAREELDAVRAEYVVVGTLASYAFAIGVALGTRELLVWSTG
ncbi:MAG: hypothetical protein HZB39_10225 [Planctomycetes bacterium]|nr:hypothetical protein [Planctomycetota bacterium]